LTKASTRLPGNAIENRPNQGRKSRAAEVVAQVKLNFAGALVRLAHRREVPASVQTRKRALKQLHPHLPTRLMQVAGGKALLQAADGHAHSSGHGVLLSHQHLCPITPRQKLRIPIDISHQSKHLFGTEPDQNRLLNRFHTIECFSDCRTGT